MTKYSKFVLVETIILAVASLVISAICVLILQSVGTLKTEQLRIGGGIVIYLVIFSLLSRYMLRRFQQLASTPSKVQEVKELSTRQQYINAQVKAIEIASSKILLCVSMLHTPKELEDAKEINAALVKAKDRGIPIQVLVADGPERLPGAYELAERHGIPLRVTPRLHFTEFRFLKVDGDFVVMGVSESVSRSKPYDPSDSWASIRSKSLGEILGKEFERIWNVAEPFRDYCIKVVREARQEHPDKPEIISEVLRIPLDFVKYCVSKG